MGNVMFDIGKAMASRPALASIPNPKHTLLDQVSEVLRFEPYSLRTQRTYRGWIRRYILFQVFTHVLIKPGLALAQPGPANSASSVCAIIPRHFSRVTRGGIRGIFAV